MEIKRFEELIDDWQDGFVYETEVERMLQYDLIECLKEIKKLHPEWKTDKILEE